MFNIFILTIALAAKDPKPIQPVIFAAGKTIVYKGNYAHFAQRAERKARKEAAKTKAIRF